MFDGYTPLFAAAASIFATVGATWLPSLIGLLRTKTARTFAFVLLLAVLGGLALSGSSALARRSSRLCACSLPRGVRLGTA